MEIRRVGAPPHDIKCNNTRHEHSFPECCDFRCWCHGEKELLRSAFMAAVGAVHFPEPQKTIFIRNS